jgi:hypothetical protein
MMTIKINQAWLHAVFKQAQCCVACSACSWTRCLPATALRTRRPRGGQLLTAYQKQYCRVCRFRHQPWQQPPKHTRNAVRNGNLLIVLRYSMKRTMSSGQAVAGVFSCPPQRQDQGQLHAPCTSYIRLGRLCTGAQSAGMGCRAQIHDCVSPETWHSESCGSGLPTETTRAGPGAAHFHVCVVKSRHGVIVGRPQPDALLATWLFCFQMKQRARSATRYRAA